MTIFYTFLHLKPTKHQTTIGVTKPKHDRGNNTVFFKKMYRLTYPQFDVLRIHLLEDVGTTLPISHSERHSLRRNIHFLFKAFNLATFAETCNTGSRDMNLDSHYGHGKQYTYSLYILLYTLSLSRSLSLLHTSCVHCTHGPWEHMGQAAF